MGLRWQQKGRKDYPETDESGQFWSEMRFSRPKGLKEEVKLVIRAAYRLPEKKGMAKLKEQVADAA